MTMSDTTKQMPDNATDRALLNLQGLVGQDHVPPLSTDNGPGTSNGGRH
jgi:hypothetical protein